MIKEIEWSYSKSQQFSQCPKAFFQDNYAKKGNDKAENFRAVPAIALSGILFHDTISKEIQEWASNHPLNKSRAILRVIDGLKFYEKEPETKIIEVRNGAKLENQFWKSTSLRTTKNIERFFAYIWPRFRNHTYLLHEKTDYILMDFARIGVRLDMCTIDENGCLTITDWKTSKATDDQKSWKQLGIYAIWASDKFGVRPEDISLLTVNVPTNIVTDFRMTTKDLKEIMEEISRECDMWEIIKEISDCPASPESRKCMGCRHLSRCDEGKNVAFNLVLR